MIVLMSHGENRVQRFWSARTRKQKQWLKITAGILVAVIFVQCIYPTDRALLLARLDDTPVSFMTQVNLDKKLLSQYETTKLTTNIRGKKTTAALNQTGVTVDHEVVAKGLTSYPWYLRLLPGSLLVKGAFTSQDVVLKTEQEKFSLYASERIKECAVAPKNAGVMVKNGEVVLDPAKDGEKCTEEGLRQQITSQVLSTEGLSVTVRTEPVKPERSDSDVSGLLKEAKTVAEREIVVSVAGKTYPIDQATLASWLAFPEDPTTKKLTVGVNDEAVKAYLATIQKEVYVAPGTTVITTYDGIETGRVNGAPGRGINMDATSSAIHTQVLSGSGTVTATLASIPANLSYNRSYSKTPAGLQALVSDLVKDKGDFAISVRKLGDSGVHANGDKQYETASTYKLFVAYSVLKRIDGGQMNWGQTTSGGQTASQCFDNMIINSDNACAEWFGKAIGWTTVQNEVRALGLSQTTLGSTFYTTANNLALYLQKLESNQLGVSEPSRARLLTAMRQQVFRQGIPAGVGVPVADKVGFLTGNLHDAAIVYSPSGVYVLVVMSKGSTWGAIADVARQIQQQLQ